MLSCWDPVPSKRPSFPELCTLTEELRREVGGAEATDELVSMLFVCLFVYALTEPVNMFACMHDCMCMYALCFLCSFNQWSHDTVKPPIKDTPKEDKPPNKGH